MVLSIKEPVIVVTQFGCVLDLRGSCGRGVPGREEGRDKHKRSR